MADGTIREGIRNSALIKNPVLFEAIGIAPVVAMAVSVKTAIMLSVISTAELIIIESFTCLCLKKIKHWFRVLIYALFGVFINVPLFMFFTKIAPNETANVSIFIPLIAVNSLVALHCERVAVRKSLKDTLVDAVSASVGYVFIVFVTAIIREILGSGTFYGYSLKLPVRLSGLLLPFGGFLLLGFIAALFKRIIKKGYPDENPEAAFNLSEISDTHMENIRDIISEGNNPFDELFADSKSDIYYEPEDIVSEKPAVKKKEKTKKEKRSVKKTEDVPEIQKTTLVNNENIEIYTVEGSTAETEKPATHARYESEFDDILNELENFKKGKEQDASAKDETPAAENNEPQKEGDGE